MPNGTVGPVAFAAPPGISGVNCNFSGNTLSVIVLWQIILME